MTGKELRDELARIAERAPDVAVADDTFTRGRRAAVRARVLVGAAVIACLALVAGVTAQALERTDTPVAGGGNSSGPGVPDHIYAPDDSPTDPDVQEVPLDEVGPSVAVWVHNEVDGQAIFVTADQDYRIVNLPHFPEVASGDVPLLLSPGGDRLAYLAEDRLSSYLALVDLHTGETDHVELSPGFGAIISSVQWSPDGDWIAWAGQRIRTRSASKRTFDLRLIGGVIRTATGDNRPLAREGQDAWSGLGVCDDGTAVRFVAPKLLVSAFDHDVESILTWHRLVSEHGPCAAPEAYAQLSSDDQEDLVGWIQDDDRPTAVAVRPNWDGDERDSYDSSGLFLNNPDGRTFVGTIDYGGHISIATGLMTIDRPTVPAGPNPWAKPWITGHWLLLVAVGAALALLVLVAVRARVVRR